MTTAELITVNIGAISLILGLLKGWKDFLNKEIAVAKENSVGATALASISKDILTLQGEMKTVMEFRSDGERRLKVLEGGYLKALEDLVNQNPYKRRMDRPRAPNRDMEAYEEDDR